MTTVLRLSAMTLVVFRLVLLTTDAAGARASEARYSST